ncbi:four-helix bundle copper-binding protein [Streptomyces sp. NPDC029674]|uniref:four-helix bundle copper-binding protein n=1 Tax=Streptomyces sp. NPDC029674 TaxID=3365297 RepID=UPI00384E86A2
MTTTTSRTAVRTTPTREREERQERQELSHQDLVRYLEDRFACAQACDDCVRACTMRQGPAESGDGSRLNTACADVCDATYRLLADQSDRSDPGDQDEQRVRMQVEWCRAVCLQCAALCGLNPASAGCADACRRCAKACDDFLTTLG